MRFLFSFPLPLLLIFISLVVFDTQAAPSKLQEEPSPSRDYAEQSTTDIRYANSSYANRRHARQIGSIQAEDGVKPMALASEADSTETAENYEQLSFDELEKRKEQAEKDHSELKDKLNQARDALKTKEDEAKGPLEDYETKKKAYESLDAKAKEMNKELRKAEAEFETADEQLTAATDIFDELKRILYDLVIAKEEQVTDEIGSLKTALRELEEKFARDEERFGALMQVYQKKLKDRNPEKGSSLAIGLGIAGFLFLAVPFVLFIVYWVKFRKPKEDEMKQTGAKDSAATVASQAATTPNSDSLAPYLQPTAPLAECSREDDRMGGGAESDDEPTSSRCPNFLRIGRDGHPVDGSRTERVNHGGKDACASSDDDDPPLKAKTLEVADEREDNTQKECDPNDASTAKEKDVYSSWREKKRGRTARSGHFCCRHNECIGFEDRYSWQALVQHQVEKHGPHFSKGIEASTAKERRYVLKHEPEWRGVEPLPLTVTPMQSTIGRECGNIQYRITNTGRRTILIRASTISNKGKFSLNPRFACLQPRETKTVVLSINTRSRGPSVQVIEVEYVWSSRRYSTVESAFEAIVPLGGREATVTIE